MSNLIQRGNEAGVVVEGRHDQGVVLLVDVQGGLDVDFGVLKQQQKKRPSEIRSLHPVLWKDLDRNDPILLTLSAASPHFSMAARPWLWMWVSRSFFSSPRPSVIRDTRLYIRPRSEHSR